MRPTGSQVREARLATGLSTSEMARRLGHSLRAYQRKEAGGDGEPTAGGSTLTPGEYELMQVLAHGEPMALVAAVAAARKMHAFLASRFSENELQVNTPEDHVKLEKLLAKLEAALDAAAPPATRKD